MRGLADIKEQDRKEVLRVYTKAKQEGDEKLCENLRYAHTIWEEDFNKADAEVTL